MFILESSNFLLQTKISDGCIGVISIGGLVYAIANGALLFDWVGLVITVSFYFRYFECIFSDTEREVDDPGEQVHVGEPRVRDPLHQRHHPGEDARVRGGQGQGGHYYCSVGRIL